MGQGSLQTPSFSPSATASTAAVSGVSTGLAASARSTAAVRRIYDIKRRQESAPLAVCVGDVHDVSVYGDVGHLPAGLLPRLLPGPTTVILPRRPDAPLSPELNPDTSTIGAPSCGGRGPSWQLPSKRAVLDVTNPGDTPSVLPCLLLLTAGLLLSCPFVLHVPSCQLYSLPTPQPW